MSKNTIISIAGIVVLIVSVWLLYPTKRTSAPTIKTNTTTNTSVANTNTATNTSPLATITFSTADLPERDPAYSFSLSLPVSWRAEYVAAAKAMNMYDKSIVGSSITASQMFVTYYNGSAFSSIDLIPDSSAANIKAGNQPTQTYDRVTNVPTAPSGFPSWWPQSHHVVEVKTGDAAPYTFYVFDFAPTLSWTAINNVISTIKF